LCLLFLCHFFFNLLNLILHFKSFLLLLESDLLFSLFLLGFILFLLVSYKIFPSFQLLFNF
jgi:hypothetical protein